MQRLILVCYVYEVKFNDLEEPRETGAGEELAESLQWLLWELSHDVRHESELENIRRDFFRPDKMDDFYDLRKIDDQLWWV